MKPISKQKKVLEVIEQEMSEGFGGDVWYNELASCRSLNGDYLTIDEGRTERDELTVSAFNVLTLGAYNPEQFDEILEEKAPKVWEIIHSDLAQALDNEHRSPQSVKGWERRVRSRDALDEIAHAVQVLLKGTHDGQGRQYSEGHHERYILQPWIRLVRSNPRRLSVRIPNWDASYVEIRNEPNRVTRVDIESDEEEDEPSSGSALEW